MTWNKKTKTIAWITVGVILLIIIILIATSGKAKAQDKSKKKSDESTGGSEAAAPQNLPETVTPPQTTQSTFPLKKGKRGKEVEQAQIYLIKKYGAKFPNYGVDGIWGNETEGNMVKFLHKNTISQNFYKSTGMDKIKTSVFV
jgi:hypothetical protein